MDGGGYGGKIRVPISVYFDLGSPQRILFATNPFSLDLGPEVLNQGPDSTLHHVRPYNSAMLFCMVIRSSIQDVPILYLPCCWAAGT